MPSTGWIRERAHPARADSPPIGLIGAPCDVAASVRGATMGPEALRVAGLPQALGTMGYAVHDRGNLFGPTPAGDLHTNGYRNLLEAAHWSRLVHDSVLDALTSGEVPVLMGGDHSLSIGSVAAAASYLKDGDRPLAVLWVDAHADFNTAESSPSGNIHGMPVAMLCGRGPGALCDLGPGRPIIHPRQVAQVAIRDVDAIEKRTVLDAGLVVHDMRQIDGSGMRQVMETVLADVTARNAHLHVSLDLDVMDPEIAPGVGTPVPGGLSYREAQLCMEMIYDSGALGSLDVVEVNPAFDARNRTATLAVELTESLFGEQILARVL